VAEGGVISVQVLNEFTSVALRKYSLPWSRIHGALGPIRQVCRIESVTLETHERATVLCERYGYSFYDALILAAALIASCSVLYSEDMQDGQVIDNRLLIRNPYI
jgi:predicted nucleic acid-binding protein